MSGLPRIAVGTVQAEADGTAVRWALMDALERWGLRVQSFLSRAHFSPRDAATSITGLAPRHLDSWLMSAEMCRDIFSRGAESSDLAIVEGSFRSTCRKTADEGGDLDTLCRWLDLPRIAIVDVSLLRECQLPQALDGVDALLLDKVRDASDVCRLQTLFQSLWNVPVLGWLESLPALRSLIDSTPTGSQPSLGLCHALGNHFSQHARLEQIYSLASRRPFAKPSAARGESPYGPRPLRIAVAYDEAFYCYFPDTLDLLEAQGATVCDFSPLRDERLPAHTDLVYLGCGHPERFAAELAENDCLMLAIKSHLCSGRRIYAEGGGLAYLCQQIEMIDGDCWPMVGALPATAKYNPTSAPPRPTEITLSADTWLGPAPLCCRGYLNTRWELTSSVEIESCIADVAHEHAVVRRHQALGSRLHLNFAAHPALVDRFFEPHPVHTDTTHAVGPRVV